MIKLKLPEYTLILYTSHIESVRIYKDLISITTKVREHNLSKGALGVEQFEKLIGELLNEPN